MKKIIPLLIIGSALLTGCTQGNISSTPTIAKSDAIAEVNGKYISKSSFEMLKKQIAQRGQPIPDEQLINELVKMELLVQEAENKKLAETPEIANQMEMMRRSMLSQAAVKDYIDSHPVTDEELKAEYEKLISAKGSSEYKARHILVKTEDEAKKIIAELKAGAKFEDLAKKKSTGPSASRGGDLGWFAPERMVPPFSEAVIALKNGEFTTEPVQTQFGWHVILRENSRDKTPPSFEELKDRLKATLQKQKVQNYLESLRKQAKVEILLPKKEEKKSEPEAASAQPQGAAPKSNTSDTAKVAEKLEKAAETAKQAVEAK